MVRDLPAVAVAVEKVARARDVTPKQGGSMEQMFYPLYPSIHPRIDLLLIGTNWKPADKGDKVMQCPYGSVS